MIVYLFDAECRACVDGYGVGSETTVENYWYGGDDAEITEGSVYSSVVGPDVG